MKAMGLELRKANDLTNVYKDVDRVLAEITPKGMAQATVAHALNKMMKAEKWVDVCTIKKLVEVCQIVIPIERMQIYEANHCIRWNEMTDDHRRNLIAMILDDFRGILQ